MCIVPADPLKRNLKSGSGSLSYSRRARKHILLPDLLFFIPDKTMLQVAAQNQFPARVIHFCRSMVRTGV